METLFLHFELSGFIEHCPFFPLKKKGPKNSR